MGAGTACVNGFVDSDLGDCEDLCAGGAGVNLDALGCCDDGAAAGGIADLAGGASLDDGGRDSGVG